MGTTNRKIVLTARPVGEPKPADLSLVTEEIDDPGEGQLLLKTLWLSLDPYMRGRMSEARSYAAPVEIGGVMVGGTVCRVQKSRHPGFAAGDAVLAYGGWQDYVLSNGAGLTKLDHPSPVYLGALGMPGLTAYGGLMRIGQPKAGETLAVAAASGPVGAMVGQIARIKGLRTVGIAGGAEKCRYLLDELGFDAAIDHRDPEMAQKLKTACPGGIDIYFENVGGAVWNAVFPLLNNFARVPVCGLIAHYNDTELPSGPDRSILLMGSILARRLRVQGFIVSDFMDLMPAFHGEVGPLVKEGRIKVREDVVDGLENAPEAFIGLLKGKNFGKLLIRVAAN